MKSLASHQNAQNDEKVLSHFDQILPHLRNCSRILERFSPSPRQQSKV